MTAHPKIRLRSTVHVTHRVLVPGYAINTDEPLLVVAIKKHRILVKRPDDRFDWRRPKDPASTVPLPPDSGFAWLDVQDVEMMLSYTDVTPRVYMGRLVP